MSAGLRRGALASVTRAHVSAPRWPKHKRYRDVTWEA
ncbi:hypothetical protein PLANTIT3_50489 [Plantibacter sp. T3]|nr:hypothetical protein PLANTIT3_50489 [Plantibacter sp. T3]